MLQKGVIMMTLINTLMSSKDMADMAEAMKELIISSKVAKAESLGIKVVEKADYGLFGKRILKAQAEIAAKAFKAAKTAEEKAAVVEDATNGVFKKEAIVSLLIKAERAADKAARAAKKAAMTAKQQEAEAAKEASLSEAKAVKAICDAKVADLKKKRNALTGHIDSIKEDIKAAASRWEALDWACNDIEESIENDGYLDVIKAEAEEAAKAIEPLRHAMASADGRMNAAQLLYETAHQAVQHAKEDAENLSELKEAEAKAETEKIKAREEQLAAEEAYYPVQDKLDAYEEAKAAKETNDLKLNKFIHEMDELDTSIKNFRKQLAEKEEAYRAVKAQLEKAEAEAYAATKKLAKFSKAENAKEVKKKIQEDKANIAYRAFKEIVMHDYAELFLPSVENRPEGLSAEEAERLLLQVRLRFNFAEKYQGLEVTRKTCQNAIHGEFLSRYKDDKRPLVIIPAHLFWARVMPWYKAQKVAETAISRALEKDDSLRYQKLLSFINSYYSNKIERIADLEAQIQLEKAFKKCTKLAEEELKKLKGQKLKDTIEYKEYLKLKEKATKLSEEAKAANQRYMDLSWREKNFNLGSELMRFLLTNEAVGALAMYDAKENARMHQALVVENLTSTDVTDSDRQKWLNEDRTIDAEDAKAEETILTEEEIKLLAVKKLIAGDLVKVGALREYHEFQEEYDITKALDMYKEILINKDGKYNVTGEKYGLSLVKGIVKLLKLHNEHKIEGVNEQYIFNTVKEAKTEIAVKEAKKEGTLMKTDTQLQKEVAKALEAANSIIEATESGEIKNLNGFKCLGLFAPYSNLEIDGHNFKNPFNYCIYAMQKKGIEAVDPTTRAKLMLALEEEWLNAKRWGQLIAGLDANSRSMLYCEAFKGTQYIPYALKKKVLTMRSTNLAFIGQMINTSTAKFKLEDKEMNEILSNLRDKVMEELRLHYEEKVSKAYKSLLVGTYEDFPLAPEVLKEHGTVEEGERNLESDWLTTLARAEAANHLYHEMVKVEKHIVPLTLGIGTANADLWKQLEEVIEEGGDE